MNRTRAWARRLAGLVAFLLVSTAAAAPVVRVAVPRDFPPHYSVDDLEHPQGFAIDVMDLVAREAGLEVRYQAYETWDETMAAVATGHADVIPNMGIAPDRALKLDFTTPYDTFAVVVFVRSSSTDLRTLDDLDGRRVATSRSNVANTLLDERPGIEVVQFDQMVQAFYALLAGHVEAVAGPKPTLLKLARDADLEQRIRELEPALVEVQRAFAVRRGNLDLLRKLEPIVAHLDGSREYQEILRKWFGHPAPFWTARRVFWGMGAILLAVVFGFAAFRYRELLAINQALREARSERDRAEQERDLLFAGSLDLLGVSDFDGALRQINDAWTHTLGWSRDELLARPWLELVAAEDQAVARATLRKIRSGEAVGEVELRLEARDRTQCWLAWSASPLREEGLVLIVARDVTERRAAEEERRRLEANLQATQRLESLGLLAGGVAHDFNNLLTTILGNIDLVAHTLPDGNEERRRLETAVTASRRAADLSNQLLAYAGKGRFVRRPLDLGGLVREMSELLSVTTDKKLRVDLDIPDRVAPIEADPSQLRQVVMNLVLNATEAMAGRPGTVRVSISERDCALEELARARLGEELPAGRYVVLEVDDDGEGMTPAIAERIFDPFFTTKFTGRGLGLAAILGIVRSHSGAITVESEPDRGSRFRVFFPTVEGAPSTTASPTTVSGPAASTEVRGTILVVEDETTLVELARDVLELEGYEVLTAGDGGLGVELFRERSGDVDLVLLDLTMPTLGGSEVFRKLRAIAPEIKVVLMSGFGDDGNVDSLRRLGLDGFLRKPFDVAELVRVVRETLAA